MNRISFTFALAACSPLALAQVAGESDIVYSEHIAPILQAACAQCHGTWPEKLVKGFDVTTYQSVMDGGYRGRPVVPGNAGGSMLARFIEGKAEPRMPWNGHPLPKETIALIRRWIDEGAQVDKDAREENEVELPGVQLRDRTPFFILCRPSGVDPHLRISIVNDDTGETVLRDWSQTPSGSWAKWDGYSQDRQLKTTPKKVTIRLYVSPNGHYSFPNPSGTVFIVNTNGDSNTNDRAARAFGRETFKPSPARPPKDTNASFSIGLIANSDIDLSIWTAPDPKPNALRGTVFKSVKVAHQSLPDLSEGSHDLPWDLRSADGKFVPAGWYTARFSCKTRRAGTFQPDFVVLFQVERSD